MGNPLGKPPGSSWRRGRGSGVAGPGAGGEGARDASIKAASPAGRGQSRGPSMEQGLALLLPLFLGLLQLGRGERGRGLRAGKGLGERRGSEEGAGAGGAGRS